jgi:hypothetical protein
MQHQARNNYSTILIKRKSYFKIFHEADGTIIETVTFKTHTMT